MPTPDADVLQDWIRRVRTEGRNLSAWEEEFIESIAEQLDRTGSLSRKQVDILERIYSEKTP